MSEKIQNSFYLIKDTVTLYNKAKQTNELKTVDLSFLKKFFKDKTFKEQPVNAGLSTEYNVWVYYKATAPDIRWKDFMATVVVPGSAILKNRKSFAESYIILFESKISRRFYASTGGYGHTTIQDIATNDLGIEILSRIVKAEDKALRATKERSLAGGIQGSVKFFRNDYNLYENETFGNIYNELNAALNKEKLIKIFGFSMTELKSDSLFIAKNSFSLKKSTSFKELLRIIEKCEELLKKAPLVEINTVEKVSKTNTSLLNALWEEIEKHVYKNYNNNQEVFSIEIANKDFERYYLASESKLFIKIKKNDYVYHIDGVLRDIQPILDYIKSVEPKLTEAEFNKSANNATLVTYDENGGETTSDPLRAHYCTEVTLNMKSYFLIEKDWYEISKTMIDKINISCTSFVQSKTYKGPKLHKWTHLSENDYNSSFIGKPNSMVFDKITPENIEACDILKWDNNNIYLFHVKKGFDNSMRDLCNQVQIAARRILEDTKNKYDYIGKLYDTLASNNGKSGYVNKAKSQLTSITRSQFIDLFKKRKVVFVLAVLDTSKKTRSLEKEMERFDSNIAKFSLNELAKNMRNLDVEFQILQIEK